MCNTALSPLFVTPDGFSDSSPPATDRDHSAAYHESLLATALIVSTMGNSSSSHSNQVEHYHSANNGLSGLIQRLCSSLTVASILGPMPQSPGILPMCWDELVDWTEHATCMTQELHHAKPLSETNTRRKMDELASLGKNDFQIVFEPYVLARQTGLDLEKLASQTYMERAQFYQDSVLVAVKRKDTGAMVCVITVFEFCRYYTLVSRRSDLEDLLKTKCGTDDGLGNDAISTTAPLVDPLSVTTSGSPLPPPSFGQPQECVICCNRTEDAVLACCNHALCADCERKWVHKRLKCPFCRQSFRSLRDAVQSQWQWNVAAAPAEQVQKDVRSLQRKIEAFWKMHVVAEDPSMTENDNSSTQNLIKRQHQEPLVWEEMLSQNYAQPKKCVQDLQDGNDDFVLVVRS